MKKMLWRLLADTRIALQNLWAEEQHGRLLLAFLGALLLLRIVTMLFTLNAGIVPPYYRWDAGFERSLFMTFLLPLQVICFGGLLWSASKLSQKLRAAPELHSMVLLAATLFALPAILTWPFGTQDIFWNMLLARGYVEVSANPYLTTPSQLPGELQGQQIVVLWRDLPMIYGPLWTWIVIVVTKLTSSLEAALILLKGLYYLAFVASVALFWKVIRELAPSKNWLMLLLLFALNPALYHFGLIDLHNDMLLLPLILGAFYLALKQRFGSSLLLLLVAALIKYVTIVVLLVPVILKIRRDGLAAAIRTFALPVLLLAVLTVLLFTPFGFSPELTSGVRNEFAERFPVDSTSVISLVGIEFLSLNVATFRLASVVLGLAAAVYFAYKGRLHSAFVVPLLILIYIGGTNLQLWYFLWLLPFLPLALPLVYVFIISSLMLLKFHILGTTAGMLILVVLVLSVLLKKYQPLEPSATAQKRKS